MNLDLPLFLKDDLVYLRPLLESDFDALFKVAKDPLIWQQHPSHDRYKKEIFIDFFDEAIASKGAFVIIDKLNNEIIGSSRFQPIENVEDAIEIGWSFLATKYWGGLYNKAVKNLMFEYAFQFVKYVVFYIAKDNIRSIKAVEKIDAVKVTTLAYQHLIKKGENDFTYLIFRHSFRLPHTKN